MKKVSIILSCLALFMFACSNEQDSTSFEPISPVSDLAITYYFNGQTILVDFEEDASGKITPIPSGGLSRVMDFIDQYPTHIYVPKSKNEIEIYPNEDELYTAYNIKKWDPSQAQFEGTATESSSSALLFQGVQRIELYLQSEFRSLMYNINDPNFRGGGTSDFWLQRRLQHFNDPQAWYYGSTEIRYNDCISSVYILPNSQQFGFRFFIDRDFGASSLYLPGGAQAGGSRDLSNNRYGFLDIYSFNNRISSMKVINASTGEELNGSVSNSGGGSTGGGSGSTDPGDGNVVGEVPEIIMQ